MSETTQCPKCRTRFPVTEAQLAAHDGLVRCGNCSNIFDARKNLCDDQPSPQLSLPMELELQPQLLDLDPISIIPELEPTPTTLAQQVQFIEETPDEAVAHRNRKTDWLGLTVVSTLSLLLIAQSLYYYRVELGARLPGLKPALSAYCELLNCTVNLPQDAEFIAIDSSELESNPEQGNLVTLHALVHNRATYTQAYPSIELTLTNFQDQAIARRVFHPQDYLKPGDNAKAGVLANRDLDIRLNLDTTELKPSGYRLFLFYPK